MNTLRCLFICSCLLLIFAGINYTISPMMTAEKYEFETSWHTANCKRESDILEELEKNIGQYEPESYKNLHEAYSYNLNYCSMRVATFTFEHISFNFNLIIGFVCFLIGLFSTQDKKIPLSHLIGMACGIIGFLLSLIYAIILGILLTQYYPSNSIYKRDSDGAVAENAGNDGFRCYYYGGKGEKKAFYAKFFDFVKSQYHYNKGLIDSYKNEEKKDCTISSSTYSIQKCADDQYLKLSSRYDKCPILYYDDGIHERSSSSPKKNYDRLIDIAIKMLLSFLISLLLLPIYGALIFSSLNLNKEQSGYTQM